jgi:protein-S-isoprenylcysteine O-methyltransferase Ste14
MTERILIVLLSLIFLGTFITRNLIVKTKIKQRVRASHPILTASIIFSNLCIFTAIFSTSSDSFYKLLVVIPFLRSPVITFFGLSLFAISIIMGWFFSAQLKESWRVGVHEHQKTQLIQNGIYQYVRNPYFLSYFIMFLSLFLVRPSLVMVVLIAISIAIFHRMVLKEETHLLKIHGTQYEKYKEATGRYIPRFSQKQS